MTVTAGRNIVLDAVEGPRPATGAAAVAARIGVPAAGCAAGLAFITLALSPAHARAFLAFAASYVMPFGIFWASPVSTVLGVPPEGQIALVAYFDAWIALFWIWNLDHLARFDAVRRMVDGTVARSNRLFLRRPWLARGSVPAIMLFVGAPMPGTGLFTGVVIGKLLGLRPRWIFLAVMVGTVTRVAILSFGTAGFMTVFGGP